MIRAVLAIRRFEPADHDAVWQLHRLGVEQTGADPGPGPWDDDLRTSAAIVATYLVAGGDFLVGVLDGQPIAIGALRPRGGYVEIKRMRVDPRWQRRGYGQRMLEELEVRARELGHSVVRLDTTTLQLAAIGLYQKNGYRETERRRHGPFEEVLFEKRLRASAHPAQPRQAYIPLPTTVAMTPAELRDSTRLVFSRIAELYDEARPGYPEAAFEDLVQLCELGPSTRVLEIGCGTGQATRDLARRARSVRCLEPGPGLAAIARRKLANYTNVTVEVSTFEEATVDAGTYDIVFSATAFHWIDAAVGYSKAAHVLRPRGWLTLVTNAHAHGGTQHEIDAELREIHQRLVPEVGHWQFPTAEQLAAKIDAGSTDIASIWARVDRSFADPPDTTALFEPATVTLHPWTADYDREPYLNMLATQSSYALLPQREQLLHEIGTVIDEQLHGRISKAYVTVLAAARRV
jgi:SAM-dependent methyltransferase/ribosomal protein S18 acetylase RimI-like enzyme